MPYKASGKRGTYRGNLPRPPERPAPVRIYDRHGDLLEIREYGAKKPKRRKP